MPKHIYKKTDKGMEEVGILPSSDEWNRKSNVGHTHAISDINGLQSKLDTIPSIKTLNTNNSSPLPISSSEARSGSGSIKLHKVSKTGNFSDLNNRGEAFLSWGGQNFVGSYGPIDAAMIPDLGANRLAFMKPAGISVEYSRDSGTTWQDYGATNDQKLGLTSTGTNFIIGKADSSNKATERYMLRISLHTSEGQVYTQLNKFALYVSTSGSNGSYCTIRARTQNNYLNKVDKWDVFANKQSISGWSGWNIINTSTITTFGNSPASQYGEIQFIFGCTSGSTSYVGLQILRLMGFGGVGWTTPSTMAKTGHIYAYDSSQNVTFPAAITSGTVNSYHILPRENNIYNLGSPFKTWANIYATTIYENGKKLSETYVKYSASQSLNDNQKAQARQNIGAGTITEIKVNGTSKGTSGSVNLTNMVTFASSQTATVAGTSKTTYTYNQPTGDGNTGSSNGSAYFPEGIIMGGTAASAGLVTRGICGVSTPDATTGACTKENLYINYDGNNTYQSGRQLVLQAGSVGTHYGHNLYEYAAARGDAVKGYCDNTYAAKSHTHNYAASDTAGGPANSVKNALTFGSKTYNGSTAQTITASDLGALTSHQDISGKVNKAGDTMSGNLSPSTTKGASLGTSSLYWNNIYGTTLYENGTSLANKYLGKTAKAADADKLDGNDSAYYLNYNNLTNKPTLGTAASKNTGTSPDNVPILDSNGKLAESVIPAVAITDTYVVANKTAMLALNAQKGDIAIRSDLNKSFVLQATPASTAEN